MKRTLIRNGTIIDGSGSPGVKGDVLIEDDRIAVVGQVPAERAQAESPETTVIDAAGKVVCPGFIDMHAHSDFRISVEGSMWEKLRQGFTTVVMGTCGFSGGPVNDLFRRDYKRMLTGMFGSACPFTWDSMGEYLDHVNKQGVGANVYPQVGYGNLRSMVMGTRPLNANDSQLNSMKSLLSKAIDDGARGFSTGLVYPMQCFSSKHEIEELCRVASARGVIYSTHVRNELDKVEQAMQEAIDIARNTGISVEISHHKAALKRNWGKPLKTMKMIEQARAEGLDVATDVYPYNSFSNMLLLMLAVNDEGLEESVILLELKNFPQYEGCTMADVMRDTGMGFRRAALHLLRKEGMGKIPIAGAVMSDDDVRFIISQSSSCIGSDGVEPDAGGKSHPRLYSTTVRFITQYVLKEKLVTLEEAVRKMTSMPAAKAKMKMRGLLKEQYFADVVVFDPAALKELSTYKDPTQPPTGFDAVIVNGRMAVLNDALTDERAGCIL